jgi:hypothetical protein
MCEFFLQTDTIVFDMQHEHNLCEKPLVMTGYESQPLSSKCVSPL